MALRFGSLLVLLDDEKVPKACGRPLLYCRWSSVLVLVVPLPTQAVDFKSASIQASALGCPISLSSLGDRSRLLP